MRTSVRHDPLRPQALEAVTEAFGGQALCLRRWQRPMRAVLVALLQLPPGAAVKLDFHWADNVRKLGDITEFFTSGSGAPDRRFNFRFVGQR